MTSEPKRLEPILTDAFINRDFVNREEKLRDLAEPVSIDPYLNVACWILLGFLALWVWIVW